MPVLKTLSRRIVTPFVLALGLLPLLAPAVTGQEIPKVTVTQAVQAEFVGQVPVTGTLVAREEVMVNPRVGGQQIVAVKVDVGDQVKAGDLLAELDRETLEIQLAQAQAGKAGAEAAVLQARAQIQQAEASAQSARTNYDRDLALFRSGTITQEKLDRSDTAYKTAQAALTVAQQGLAVAKVQVEQAEIKLRLADLNLSYTRITAPAAGEISTRNAAIGAVANAAPDPMFRIIKDNLIEVSTEVIENDIARLTVGDTAELQVAGVGALTGVIRLISPRVDARTRLGEVRISLPENPALRIGVFASGRVTAETFSALGVPVSAVLSDGDGDFTQIVDSDGIIHKRRVKAGLIWNGLREIRSGLVEGDTVVLLAGAFFREGDKVDPVPLTGASR